MEKFKNVDDKEGAMGGDTTRIGKRQEIIYGAPEFKTGEDLLTFLYENTAAGRREELREWYVAGEQLMALAREQQDAALARNTHYIRDLREIDIALPEIKRRVHDALDNFLKGRNKVLDERIRIVQAAEEGLGNREKAYMVREAQVKAAEAYITTARADIEAKLRAADKKEKEANDLYARAVQALKDATAEKEAATQIEVVPIESPDTVLGLDISMPEDPPKSSSQ